MIVPPVPVSNYAQLLVGQIVAQKVKPFVPLAATTGMETWFEGSGVLVCTEPGQWSQVWDRHIKNQAFGNVSGVRNLNPAPSVDFDSNLVVAVFSGPTRGVLGYRVVNGFIVGTQATLRLVPITTNDPKAGIAVPSPWTFLVLPRSPATVKIDLLGPGGWKTIGTVRPSL